MSQVIKKFNAISGTITKAEAQKLAIEAKAEGQIHLHHRLTSALEAAKHLQEDVVFNPGTLAFEEIPSCDLPGIDHVPSYISAEDFTGLNKAVSPDDIYTMITNKLIAFIKEAKAGDYKKKWQGEKYGKGYLIPFNFVSKKRYRGVNHFLLTDFVEPLENPFFLTFKQVGKLKGKVTKGSVGREVVYFTRLYSYTQKEPSLSFSTYDKKKFDNWFNANKHQIPKRFHNYDHVIPILKYYKVFNGKDIEGIDFDLENFKTGFIENELPPNVPMPIADAIVANFPSPKVSIKHGGDKAAYYPGFDHIKMPHKADFETAQDYYRTLFHELGHSTGAAKRLNRDFGGKFGSKKYAFEELIAELNAVFVSAEAGFMWHTNKNHAGYLKNWNSVLTQIEDDNRFVMRAASQAQKATDFILQPDRDGNPLYLKTLKIEKKKETAAALNAPWHEGLAKQALNNCSRLNPGYNYSKDGKLQRAKVTLKTLKDVAHKAADFEAAYKAAMLLEVPAKVVKTLREKYNEDLKLNPKEVFGAFYKDVTGKSPAHTIKKNDARVPAEKEVESKVKKIKTGKDFPLIIEYPIDQILIDTNRFQNRTKLNEKTVQNIVDNFTATQFDPVILWIDPKNKKTYLLAGHHRLEAYKRLNKDNVPSKFANKDYPTEADAIKYARQLSNANRTLETPMERAKIYREMLNNGETAKAIEKASKIEGKNQNYILNLAALNDNGRVIEALERLADTPDKQNEKALEKIADWIGEARRKYPQLTNAHETEMFKFLNDASASKRIKTKSDFLQKIYSSAGTFDFDDAVPLNLNRVKYESEGEKVYNKDYSEMKQNISDKLDTISTIKARFTDPSRKDYENPSKKDYKDVKERADDKISQLNTEIGRIQKRMIELQRNKGSYTKAGQEQAALFGGLNGAGDFNKKIMHSAKTGYENDAVFVLGYPQGELKKHLPASQITLSGKVLKKVMAQTKDHNLNWGNIVDLPKNINNPQAIFKSKTKGFVILTYVKNMNKKPIMVAIHMEEKNNLLNIASMYVRNNFGSYKKWIDEGLLLFVDKKSELFPYRQATIAIGGNNPRGNKNTKKKPKNKKSGLKRPTIEPKTNAGGQSIGGSCRPLLSGKHPKVRSIKHQAEKNPMFAIDGETAKFLQAVEKKPKGSVIVTFDGPQGAGKTTGLYKFQNDFATAGHRCLFASLEEHPSSNLATDKKDKYLMPGAQENIDTVGSFDDYAEFLEIVKNYDAIFIDSWQKLIQMIGAIRMDEDIRKKFDGKVFFIVFQQTTEGRTKGGASIVFDGDIVIKMVKMPSFSDNYAFFDKNRYTTVPIENLKYMIADGKTIIEGETTSAVPAEKEILASIPENEEMYNFKVY